MPTMRKERRLIQKTRRARAGYQSAPALKRNYLTTNNRRDEIPAGVIVALMLAFVLLMVWIAGQWATNAEHEGYVRGYAAQAQEAYQQGYDRGYADGSWSE
jgi:hypothetical protein